MNLLTQQEVELVLEKTANKAGVSPVIQKIGIAVLRAESNLDPMACCFNLPNRKALYNCVFDGGEKILHKITNKVYTINKEKKTLTYRDEVLKYWSWDRGCCMWNSFFWKDITDEIAFDPEQALPPFWYWFSRKPNWWGGYSSGNWHKFYGKET